jgi:hypothetical protein
MLKWRELGLVAVLVMCGTTIGLLAKHDRDQQRRLNVLAADLSALTDNVHGLVMPMQAVVPLLSHLSDEIAARQLERSSQVASGKPAVHAAGNAPPAASEQAEPAAMSPVQQVALARAHRVLEGAIGRRTLTRDDVLEMRTELATVNSRQAAEELRAKIASAINRNELVPEDRQYFMP